MAAGRRLSTVRSFPGSNCKDMIGAVRHRDSPVIRAHIDCTNSGADIVRSRPSFRRSRAIFSRNFATTTTAVVIASLGLLDSGPCLPARWLWLDARAIRLEPACSITEFSFSAQSTAGSVNKIRPSIMASGALPPTVLIDGDILGRRSRLQHAPSNTSSMAADSVLPTRIYSSAKGPSETCSTSATFGLSRTCKTNRVENHQQQSDGSSGLPNYEPPYHAATRPNHRPPLVHRPRRYSTQSNKLQVLTFAPRARRRCGAEPAESSEPRAARQPSCSILTKELEVQRPCRPAWTSATHLWVPCR